MRLLAVKHTHTQMRFEDIDRRTYAASRSSLLMMIPISPDMFTGRPSRQKKKMSSLFDRFVKDLLDTSDFFLQAFLFFFWFLSDDGME